MKICIAVILLALPYVALGDVVLDRLLVDNSATRKEYLDSRLPHMSNLIHRTSEWVRRTSDLTLTEKGLADRVRMSLRKVMVREFPGDHLETLLTQLFVQPMTQMFKIQPITYSEYVEAVRAAFNKATRNMSRFNSLGLKSDIGALFLRSLLSPQATFYGDRVAPIDEGINFLSQRLTEQIMQGTIEQANVESIKQKIADAPAAIQAELSYHYKFYGKFIKFHRQGEQFLRDAIILCVLSLELEEDSVKNQEALNALEERIITFLSLYRKVLEANDLDCALGKYEKLGAYVSMAIDKYNQFFAGEQNQFKLDALHKIYSNIVFEISLIEKAPTGTKTSENKILNLH